LLTYLDFVRSDITRIDYLYSPVCAQHLLRVECTK